MTKASKEGPEIIILDEVHNLWGTRLRKGLMKVEIDIILLSGMLFHDNFYEYFNTLLGKTRVQLPSVK